MRSRVHWKVVSHNGFQAHNALTVQHMAPSTHGTLAVSPTCSGVSSVCLHILVISPAAGGGVRVCSSSPRVVHLLSPSAAGGGFVVSIYSPLTPVPPLLLPSAKCSPMPKPSTRTFPPGTSAVSPPWIRVSALVVCDMVCILGLS